MTDYNNLDNYNWLESEVDKHETPQALALGKLILEKFGNKSVLDVGCSSGIYLMPFKDAGCDYYGIDGASGVGKWVRPDNFEVVDFRTATAWKAPRPFDLTLCIEVSEHVPFEYHDNLFRIITESAPMCFFSCAHVGQGGEGHVAESDRPYVDGKFSQFGFMYDAGLTATLHSVIDVDPAYEHCMWLRNHSWIYRKA